MDWEEITVEQRDEIVKCVNSFKYFASNYVKILHPVKGLIPLNLHPYQERYVRDLMDNRFVIGLKFRQGGFSTVTQAYVLWLAMFKSDQSVMTLAKTDREAIALKEIVSRMIANLPEWIMPVMSTNNQHQVAFADTGSKLFYGTPEAGRGRSIGLLVLDEAAFIPQMEKHWNAMFPCIACGGKVVALSTPNGVGNWFYDIYRGSEKGQNQFYISKSTYWEHPDYQNPEWVTRMRAQLGERGWLQEVECCFIADQPCKVTTNSLDILTKFFEKLTPEKAEKLVGVFKQIVS